MAMDMLEFFQKKEKEMRRKEREYLKNK